MKLDTSSVMMNTGTLAIFLALICQIAAAGYLENFKQLIQPLAEDCMKYVGASDADVEKVSTLETLSTQSQHCLLYCAFNQAGLMSGTKLASEDDILNIVNELHKDDEELLAQTPEVVHICSAEASDLKTDDACLLADFLLQCVHGKALARAYQARN